MGERYDVTFVADNPGAWLLGAYDTGFGEGGLQIPVLYKGVNRKEPAVPTFHRGLRMASYFDFEALHPTESPIDRADRYYDQILGGGMHSSYWTINGQVYPAADPLIVRQGEWVRLRYGRRFRALWLE